MPIPERETMDTIYKKIRFPMGSERLGDAVVVLSGGQDSTTCYFWAKMQFRNVYAIFFDYGQRHAEEEGKCVKRLTDHQVQHFTLPIAHISASSLLGMDGDVNAKHPIFPKLPATFVPFRNLLMLTLAGSYAIAVGAQNVITGVCQTDYSGYPDCRESFIIELQECWKRAVDFSPGERLKIWTPLMYLTKAETVHLAKTMEGCYDALAYTHTCYNGSYPPCGTCPACELRAKGFAEAGFKDPLLTRGKE